MGSSRDRRLHPGAPVGGPETTSTRRHPSRHTGRVQLLVICGPPAVGKMTVGRAIAARSASGCTTTTRRPSRGPKPRPSQPTATLADARISRGEGEAGSAARGLRLHTTTRRSSRCWRRSTTAPRRSPACWPSSGSAWPRRRPPRASTWSAPSSGASRLPDEAALMSSYVDIYRTAGGQVAFVELAADRGHPAGAQPHRAPPGREALQARPGLVGRQRPRGSRRTSELRPGPSYARRRAARRPTVTMARASHVWARFAHR